MNKDSTNREAHTYTQDSQINATKTIACNDEFKADFQNATFVYQFVPVVFVVTPLAVAKQVYELMVAPLLDGSANARVRAFPDTTVVAEVITTCAGALELPLLEESTTNMNTIIRIICTHSSVAAHAEKQETDRK